MVKKNKMIEVIKLLRKSQKNLRKTNLNREAKKYTPFQTLISCIISLRIKDETSEKISRKLFRIANTPKKISKLPQKKLEKIIFSSGFYKNKARTIKKIAKHLIEKHNGEVPSKEEHLLEIHGIGRKTANIVLSLAFNKNAIPVDANVHRIFTRLGWFKAKSPEETEKKLMKIIPKKYWREINGLCMLHGKKVCVSVSPFCSRCVVFNYCRRRGVKKKR